MKKNKWKYNFVIILLRCAGCLSAVLFTSHQGTRYRLSLRRDATNKAIDGVIAPFTSSCSTAGVGINVS
eukprot:scaffold1022_cov196-Alexandrium_tamarense.AAC.6